MRFHGVNLLHCAVKLDGFGSLVASGAEFLVLVLMLRGALLSVFFKDFTNFQRVPGAMQQACLFFTFRRITWIVCIFSLALVSAALLGVG